MSLPWNGLAACKQMWLDVNIESTIGYCQKFIGGLNDEGMTDEIWR